MPDFLGIGAMRSGTSWLRRNLARHPQIWMAEPKELHFFDRHIGERRWWWLPAEREARVRYGRHFRGAPRVGVRVGEFTPAYAVLGDEMIARVRRWMPGARLLFIMRDPVERAWSHARKDYERYWSNGKGLGQAELSDLEPFFAAPDVARRGDYVTCLRAWLAHFPREQLWTGFMDDVASGREEEVLRSVFQFLGVDAGFGIDRSEARKVVNPRPPAPMPDGVREYLEEQLYGQNEALQELLGEPLPWARITGGRA